MRKSVLTSNNNAFHTAIYVAVFTFATAISDLGNTLDGDRETADTGQSSSYYHLTLEELTDVQVITASRIPETIDKSPASITVIRANDIHHMGARTIFDVLRTIPGISIQKSSLGRHILELRGVRNENSHNVLILLDGHRLSTPITEDATSTLR